MISRIENNVILNLLTVFVKTYFEKRRTGVANSGAHGAEQAERFFFVTIN